MLQLKNRDCRQLANLLVASLTVVVTLGFLASCVDEEARAKQVQARQDQFAQSFDELIATLELRGIRTLVVAPIEQGEFQGTIMFGLGGRGKADGAGETSGKGLMAALVQANRAGRIAVLQQQDVQDATPGPRAVFQAVVESYKERGDGAVRVERISATVKAEDTGETIWFQGWNLLEIFPS